MDIKKLYESVRALEAECGIEPTTQTALQQKTGEELEKSPEALELFEKTGEIQARARIAKVVHTFLEQAVCGVGVNYYGLFQALDSESVFKHYVPHTENVEQFEKALLDKIEWFVTKDVSVTKGITQELYKKCVKAFSVGITGFLKHREKVDLMKLVEYKKNLDACAADLEKGKKKNG